VTRNEAGGFNPCLSHYGIPIIDLIQKKIEIKKKLFV
jgi:hypothetical protein